MSSTRGWLVGREGSRAILDVILLRQPEIAFVFWRLQHTPLTHTELIVGENLFTPSEACPLGFGASVPDFTFAWSCFMLLDLAPCSGLERSSLDLDSLPRPRALPVSASSWSSAVSVSKAVSIKVCCTALSWWHSPTWRPRHFLSGLQVNLVV